MLGRSAALVWNNFGSLFWLYLRISVVGWVLFGAGLYIWMMVLRPESIGRAFLLGQAMIVVWLGTRLWQRASETEWYRQYGVSLRQPVPMPPPAPAPIPEAETIASS